MASKITYFLALLSSLRHFFATGVAASAAAFRLKQHHSTLKKEHPNTEKQTKR